VQRKHKMRERKENGEGRWSREGLSAVSLLALLAFGSPPRRALAAAALLRARTHTHTPPRPASTHNPATTKPPAWDRPGALGPAARRRRRRTLARLGAAAVALLALMALVRHGRRVGDTAGAGVGVVGKADR